MLKIVGQSLIGIILTIGGVYLLYQYIASLNKNANILFFILSIICIGGGIFLLILTERSETVIRTRTAPDTTDTSETMSLSKETFGDKLAKNNEMISDWKRVNSTKNKMKMVQISATPVDDSSK